MKRTVILLLLVYSVVVNGQHLLKFEIDQPEYFSVNTGPNVWTDGQEIMHLSVEANGGSGHYSYEWRPEMPLDESRAASPRVMGLEETTMFEVRVSDGFCEKASTLWVELSSSLMGPWQSAEVKMYPNPARDYFQLETGEELLGVYLLDLSGRVLKSWKGGSEMGKYGIGDLSQGTYMVEVRFFTHSTKRMMICKL